MKKICEIIIKILLKPWIGSLIAGTAVLAGLLASIYADEIRTSFPIYHPSLNPSDYGKTSIPSLLFWIAVFIFFIFTALRQNFRDKDLNHQRKNLIDSLQTLPPHEFALKYRDEYLKSEDNLFTIDTLLIIEDLEDPLNSADLQDIEEKIRIVLDTYINLAKLWDQPESIIPDNIIYRANIMLYYPINNIPAKIEQKLFNMNHFFVEKNLSSLKSSIDGILILEDNAFTTTTLSEEPLPDDDIKPLCFPITLLKDEKGDKRIQNLPGAPTSFVKEKIQWILDSNDIIDICKNDLNYDGIVLKRIQEYYSNENKARSIISIPLRKRLLIDKEIQYITIGIINIYRNKERILKDKVRSAQFSAFLEPYNEILYKLIQSYEKVKEIVDINSAVS